MMQPFLKLLVEDLEREERDAVARRVEMMESELKYLQEAKPKEIAVAMERGWTANKFQVVFCLNSFYQRILAPLWASAQAPSVIGSRIPIRYGKSIIFDAKRNAAINKMGMRFLKLCASFQITQQMLEAQRTSDLIWITNKPRFESDDEKQSE